MPERPHSRKVKTVEGTAEVKKGEKIENSRMAGEGGAPIASAANTAGEEKQGNGEAK